MKKTLLVICVTLASCATGYQKYGFAGGYKETSLGENRYLVEYLGNGTTDSATIDGFWNRRASELCPSGFEVIEDEDGSNVNVLPGALIMHPWKKGKIECISDKLE